METRTVNDICASCELCCKGTLTNVQCPSYTSSGCVWEYSNRPIPCQQYPFILVHDNRFDIPQRIFIDTACPYYHLFTGIEEIRKSTEPSLIIG